jgi:hypothetical protein
LIPEQLDNLGVAFSFRKIQGGLALAVLDVHIESFSEQILDYFYMSRPGGQVKGRLAVITAPRAYGVYIRTFGY